MVGSGLTSPHIRFYISDYGFGHASRCIALMRALHESIHCTISVRTDTSANFIRDSCPFVFVDKKHNDIGTVMYSGTSKVNVSATKERFQNWIELWSEWIEDEIKYCVDNNVDLIISDITPQAFCVSKYLNIPGIAISNFTWELIFSNLFGCIKGIEKIRAAYNNADLALVLPLNESMPYFQRKINVSLLSRKTTRTREEMRKKYNLSNDDVVIYVGSGLSFNAVPNCISKTLSAGYFVLTSSNMANQFMYDELKQPATHNQDKGSSAMLQIPESDTETQDYIGMCDLVITKPGYSTVSESIQSKVPIVIFGREGFAEDEYIIRPLVENKLGVSMSWDDIESGGWVNNISEFISLKNNYQHCSDIFIRDGIPDILHIIEGYI